MGAVALGKYLYALGGSYFSVDLKSVERYDPEADEWEEVALTNICGSGAVALGNYLYAVGRKGGVRPGCSTRSSTVERYDPEADEWTKVASMKSYRDELGMVALGKYLYAVGGKGSYKDFKNTVERYDAEADEWKEMAPLKSKRSCLGVGVL